MSMAPILVPQESAGRCADSRADRLLVVILNYNGLEDTIACLESLSRQTCRQFKALVIDNGSRTDEASMLRRRFEDVEVVDLQANLGWAGGNNVGIQAALDRGMEYICLLNNDTVVEETALEELLVAMDVIGEPCLLHPSIAYFDKAAGWQLRPERPTTVMPEARFFPEDAAILEMNYAYGACLMFSTDLVRQLGVLDERFFLQMEETDFFSRAVARGFRSFCALRACVWHRESASFGARTTPDKTYYQVRNGLLLSWKHRPSYLARMLAAREIVWAVHYKARESGARVQGWTGFLRWMFSSDPLARAARDGAWDFVRGRFGRRPLSRARQAS